MAVEKVGVYRKWLEPVPVENGKPIPRELWPKKRRYSWIVRWYGTNNKRYGKVLGTRKEAERYALDLQNRINLGNPDKPKKITLADFKREHIKVMQGQVAYGTLQDQMRVLKLFEKFIGGSRILHKIRPREAEAFIAYRLQSGITTGTVNKDIRTLRRIFNLAIELRGYLPEGQNPFAKIRQRKRSSKPVRYVEIEEYRQWMDAAEGVWWKTLVSIAYGCGLRRNEILNLTWVDIDFDKQLIHVRPKRETANTIEWEPKDHEMRIVPMPDETLQFLAEAQAEAHESHAYIFISPQRLNRIKQRKKECKWNSRSEIINNMRKNFQRIRHSAGLERFTLHDLRRSAITNWARRLPVQVVQQLAGHSDISTTREYYIAVEAEDMIAANAALNDILRRCEGN